MKRLTAIDAARGIASVMVMLFHCNAVVQSPKYFHDVPFGGFFGLGGVRMPFFFAMSGFMLCLVHAGEIGRPNRAGRYLLARFARIYPAYWVVLALTVPVYLLRPDFGSGPEGGTANAWTVLKSFVLWPQPGVPYLAVAWTLQSMVLFYLVFALAIWRPRAGLAVFTLWQVTVLGFVVAGIQLPFPWSFFLQPLYFCFLLGGVASALATRSTLRQPGAWIWAGLIFLVASAILDFLKLSPITFDRTLILNGVASAALLLGLAAWEMKAPRRVPAFLQHIGEASYSIFLIHYPLLSVLSKLGMKAGIGRLLNGEAIFILFSAVCVVAGIGFHRWIEKPLTSWVQARLGLARTSRASSVPPSSNLNPGGAA